MRMPRRYKGIVGKRCGSRLYLHKAYAALVVPVAKLELARFCPFEHNCVMYDLKSGVIRFDEAPDFDEAREPRPGQMYTVFPAKKSTLSSSPYIWHHKWLWVMDDYKGFDLEEAKQWSKSYMDVLTESPKASKGTWLRQLYEAGLLEEVRHFNDLPSRRKWEIWDKQEGTWHCPDCKANVGEPQRASPIRGASVHCSNCDYELTCRTGGGQSDPFNWRLHPCR